MQRTDWNITFNLFETVKRNLQELREYHNFNKDKLESKKKKDE